MKEVIKIEENVDKITINDSLIILVGTAHISNESVELVERIIREYKPDVVAVELCEPRLQSLEDPDRWKNTDIVTVIRQGRSNVLLTQLILAAFQRKIGKHLNIKPGAEMLKAVAVGRELNARIALIDRSVSVTMKRVWRGLGFWGTVKLCWSLVYMAVGSHKVDAEEIERLKSADVMQEVMGEFTKAMPEVRTALIDERDSYLAGSLKQQAGKTTVAVVGAAHVPGMLEKIDSVIDLAELNQLPPPSRWGKVIGWSVPAVVVGVMVYAFFEMGSSASMEMAWTFIWITGLSGAIGGALALAHPITILSSFVTAPIAAIHPLIAAGWLSGLIEAVIRKPRVRDFENIMDDIESVKGLFSNRVTRTLLIVAFTNLAVMAGMAISAGKILSLLSRG